MSEQEEQQQPESVDDIIGASVVLPVAHSSLLDFLYLYGLPILPYYGGGGGGVAGGGGGVAGGGGGVAGGGGVGLGNQNVEMEQVVASILAGSLYERNPVKKVFDEEACCEIIDKKFTATLVEQMKINVACGIWQEDFEEGEDIKILPCNHAFKAEAIMKWLKNEKAECPMCRFVLKSKELICRENEEGHDDDNDVDNNDEEAAAPQPQHEREPEPERNNHAIRINNIASRIVQSVAGRVNHMYSNPPHGYEESISVPISHLIERRRNMISQARNVAAARAAIPSSGGAAAVSYANANREVRAEAIQHAAAPVNNNNLNNNNPNYNIINNNFYYYDNNNNNNYNNNYDEDFMLNQEQADIEEAIRRSLEQI